MPVLMILFPILEINFEPLGTNEKQFVKDFFYQSPVSRKNNSDDSISCLKNNFVLLGIEKHFKK